MTLHATVTNFFSINFRHMIIVTKDCSEERFVFSVVKLTVQQESSVEVGFTYFLVHLRQLQRVHCIVFADVRAFERTL